MAPKKKPENRSTNRKQLPKEAEPFRFKPGVSGNPGGRPKKKRITELYEEMLDDPQVMESLRASLIDTLTTGNMAMVLQLREMADRTEGKVTQPIEHDVTESLADAIAAARKRAGR